MLQYVLQYVLQCVAVCCRVLLARAYMCGTKWPSLAKSVFQCVAVCYSVLQCVAVCCLQVRYSMVVPGGERGVGKRGNTLFLSNHFFNCTRIS